MKLMIFKWEGNSYGISLDKLQSANNHIKNIKKIHPFFQDFKIPKKTKSLALKSGFFFPTQEMPKIEEVEIERNIDLPYLSEDKVIGYRMLYPYKLTLGKENKDGTIPINYSRWCPFSPIEDHRISGEHIISVVYPDNNIVDNYAIRLKEIGLTEEQIFWKEETNGDNSKPTETK